MSLFNIFLQPYPLWDNNWRKFYSITGISIFIFLFLFVFRPFGLSQLEIPSETNVLTGYVLVILLIILLLQFVLPFFISTVFNEERWKVYKEILYTLIIVLCIGIGIMMYSAMLGLFPVTLSSFTWFEIITMLVTLIPITLIVLLKQNYLFRKNVKEGFALTEKLYRKTRISPFEQTLVLFTSEQQDDNLKVESADIYYITGADNFIEVHIKQQDQIKKVLLRSTLRNAQQSLKRFSNFYRCHRSYIINLDKVQSVSGNSQGFKLVLADTEKSIPVSRTLTREVTQRLSI